MARVLRLLAALIGTLLVLVLIAGGVLYLWFSGAFDGGNDRRADAPTPAQEETGPQTLRIPLLEAEGFDPAAPGAALLLHPLATGLETPLLISDPEALSAAAERAYFTDYPRRDLQMIALSVLFLQPPTERIFDPFSTLFQDGREVDTRMCTISLCSSPDHARDLAGLPGLGVPVRMLRERVQGRAAAAAREAEVIATPNHVMIRGMGEQDGPATLFDGFVTLQWPTVFGPIGQADETVFDEDLAAFSTEMRRFTASLPFSVGLDGWEMDTARAAFEIYSIASGRRVVSTGGDVRQATPEVRIWVDAVHLEALQNAVASFDWVTLYPGLEEAEVADWLAETLTANQLFGAPENYDPRLRSYSRVDVISVSELRLPEIELRYFAPLP